MKPHEQEVRKIESKVSLLVRSCAMPFAFIAHAVCVKTALPGESVPVAALFADRRVGGGNLVGPLAGAGTEAEVVGGVEDAA